MLEEIKYVNHLNETLYFAEPKLFVQTSDLHDFSWNVNSKNDRISGFRRGINSKSITIVIKGTTEDECIKLCNQLFDVVEKDTLAVKYGKLFVGNYYLKCFVVGSKKSEYNRTQGFLKVTLTITTDASFWVKESTTTFGYGVGDTGTNLDFNRDFPSDYTSNLIGKKLNNTGFVDTNFHIVIYGACEMPGITIGGHLYEVNVSVAANEYLTIDSVNKTIILTHTDGTTKNCFNLRNRDSYIFQKMPVGLSDVSVSSNFKFDVVLLEERSEPKWI